MCTSALAAADMAGVEVGVGARVGVLVGGTKVGVGGIGVAVGSEVGVGGTGVAVGSGVLVGGTGVAVGGAGVSVGAAASVAATSASGVVATSACGALHAARATASAASTSRMHIRQFTVTVIEVLIVYASLRYLNAKKPGKARLSWHSLT